MVAYDEKMVKRGQRMVEDRRGKKQSGGQGIARRIANDVGGRASRTVRRGAEAHKTMVSMLTPDGGPRKKAKARGVAALAERPVTPPRKPRR